MQLPCPSCQTALTIRAVDSALNTEASCGNCNAIVGIAITTTLLQAGTETQQTTVNHTAMVAIADSALRRSYANALNNVGWKVQQAGEGRETLQMMAKEVPDVAIIDGGFAPIFGMGLGEIIKKSNITRSVRVLGLKADDDTLLPLPGAERTISLTAGAETVLEEVNRLLPSNGTPTPQPTGQTGFISRPQAAPQTMATTTETTAEPTTTLADSPEHQSAKRLARDPKSAGTSWLRQFSRSTDMAFIVVGMDTLAPSSAAFSAKIRLAE